MEYDPWLNGGDIIYRLRESYSPTKFSTLPKFDISLKFEFFRFIKKFFFFLKFKPLEHKYVKFFFSFKQLKLFSIKIVEAFFSKFINPNKPLTWKKSERLISKKRGLAFLRIWKIIYWQLVYESFNEVFFFTKRELKLLKLAEINPFDSWYYWPTRWLNLLNLSIFSGKLSTWSKITIPYTNYYAKHFLLVVERELWLKIFLQLLFWRSQLIGQIDLNLLFHNQLSPSCKDDKLWINNYSIPFFYYGYQNQYFKKNFLFFEFEAYAPLCEEPHFYLKELKQTASCFLSVFYCLKDINYTKKLSTCSYVTNDTKKLLIYNKKEIGVCAVVCYTWVLENKDVKQIFSDNAKLIQNLSVEDLNNELFKKINSQKCVPGIYPIPAFIWELFLLLSTKLVNLALLEEKFVKWLLYNHPLYIKAYNVATNFKKYVEYYSKKFKKKIYFKINKLKKFKFKPLFWYWIFLFFFKKLSNKSCNSFKKLQNKYKYDFLNYIFLYKPYNNFDSVLFPSVKTFRLNQKNIFFDKKKYFFKPWIKYLIFFNINFFLKKIKKNTFKFFKQVKHWYYFWFEFKFLKNSSLYYFTELNKYIEWFQLLLDPTIESFDLNKNLFEMVNLLPDHFKINSFIVLKKKQLDLKKKLEKNKRIVKWFKWFHFFKWLNERKQSFLLQLFGVQLKFIHKNVELLHSNSISFYQNFYYFSLSYYYSLFNQSYFSFSNFFLFKKNFFSFIYIYFIFRNNFFLNRINIILKI